MLLKIVRGIGWSGVLATVGIGMVLTGLVSAVWIGCKRDETAELAHAHVKAKEWLFSMGYEAKQISCAEKNMLSAYAQCAVRAPDLVILLCPLEDNTSCIVQVRD